MSIINPHTSRAAGIILTAGIYNADHINHTSNAQTLNTDKVETSRAIATGSGLQGGGNLTADRTLSPDYATQAEAEDGTAATKIANPLRVRQGTINQVGQCRLTLSGANLLLAPFDGNRLFINGSIRTLPDAGITLGSGALAVDTTFNIYAFWSGSAIVLEAVTTAAAVQAGTGIVIKTADATRTFVGMARTITGPLWVNTPAQRFVISHFNRRSIACANAFAANRTTTSVTFVELSSTERAEFLNFADEGCNFDVSGAGQHGTANAIQYTTIGFSDATPEEGASRFQAVTVNVPYPVALSAGNSALAAGYNYATVVGRVTSGTGTWLGSVTVGERLALTGTVRD